MRKILRVALFAMVLAGLTVTAANAGRPGCDGKRNASASATAQGTDEFDNNTFFGMQEARAQSIRVRDRATARQIQHQNDNGPGMTCFDHAMALTSRLGQLFSDIKPTSSIPAASVRAFGQVSFPNYGTDSWMSQALDVVIAPTLSKHAAQFAPDSLSYMLGATQFPFWGSFMSTLNGYISQIMGIVGQITYYVNQLNSLWTYFQQIVDLLNGQVPLWIMTWVPLIVSFWNTVVLPMINSIIGGLMSTISGFVNNITSTIMGALGSMTNFMNPLSPMNGGGECARIQNLWGVGGGFPNIIGGGGISFQTGPIMRALTGTGVQTGNAYFSYSQLLSLAPPGTGNDFINELKLPQPALNQDMMTRALGNLTGALSSPSVGTLKSWTQPPAGYTFGAQSAASIIGAM